MDKFTLTLLALVVFAGTVTYLMTNDGGKNAEVQQKERSEKIIVLIFSSNTNPVFATGFSFLR